MKFLSNSGRADSQVRPSLFFVFSLPPSVGFADSSQKREPLAVCSRYLPRLPLFAEVIQTQVGRRLIFAAVADA